MNSVPLFVIRCFTIAVASTATWAAADAAADSFQVAQGQPSRSRQPAPAAQPPAQAQTQQQPAAPAAPQGQAAAPQPGPALKRTEVFYFDNWTVTCNEFAEGPKKRACAAQLQVKQAQNNNVVFAWTVSIDDDKRPLAVLQTPTGISIAPGVEVRLGKASPRKIPLTMCETGRCIASTTMDAAFVRDLSTTPNAEVVIYAPNGAGVQFNFPLKGFESAYAEVQR